MTLLKRCGGNMDKINIGIIAPLTSYSGYGQYGRAISLMLQDLYKDEQGIQLFVFDSISPSIKQQTFILEKSKYKDLKLSPIKLLQEICFTVFMTVSIPQTFLKKGIRNIGITALAQTDKVHPNLITKCNQMDEVWVMSQFNIDSLKISKFLIKQGQTVEFTKSVKTLPHPFLYDKDNITDYKTEITDFIDSIQQEFLFLNVGQWLPGSIGNDRKDIGMVVSTFLKKYANNKQIGLLLKVDMGKSSILSQYSIRQKINQIYKALGKECQHNNIYIISGNLLQSQMLQIYMHNKVKAFISFSHGESWGIPIMQFSGLTGKPLLVPYHSGFAEFVRPQCCQILLHKSVTIPKQFLNSFYRQFVLPQSKWFTVDYQYAMFKFGELVDSYNKKNQRYKLQQTHILQNFNMKKVQEILSQHLKRFLQMQREL